MSHSVIYWFYELDELPQLSELVSSSVKWEIIEPSSEDYGEVQIK